MSSIIYHLTPQLTNALSQGLYNYLNIADPLFFDEILLAISELELAKNIYEVTYNTKTICLAVLWGSVQSSINSHMSIYLSAGFTNNQLLDISSTYLFLSS